jgi:hypothetical protein
MSDELKRYKKQIKDELMNGLHNQADIQRRVESGGAIPRTKAVKKVRKGICSMCQRLCPSCSGGGHDSDNDSDGGNEIIGGNRHAGLVKTFKKMGHSISHNKLVKGVGKELLHTGKAVGTAVVNEAKKEGTKYALNGLKDLALGATETVATNPELLLLAAGVKKPKQKRAPSEKQKRRHSLIRELMKEHHCSLAEASSHIKQHNLA